MIGFHIAAIIPDLLHVFNLGVGRDLCGSILKTIIKDRYVFPGSTVEERLASATSSLRTYARTHSLPLRIKKLTKKKLNFGENRYAELRSGSGYDISVIGRWLEEALSGFTHIYPDFATLLWTINVVMSTWYHGSSFLSGHELTQVRTLGRVFITVYLKCARAALDANQMLWRCRPKLHLLAHLLSPRISCNPARFSRWMDEDFLKKIGKTLRLVDSTTAQQRILQRWLLAIPLHLKQCMDADR